MAAQANEGLASAAGRLIDTDDGPAYEIEGFDRMKPFLTTLLSDGDRWMYVSSKGGLTAGRSSPDLALFAYRTADLLHEAHRHTGPMTVLRIQSDGGPIVVEPLAPLPPSVALEAVDRRIARTTLGDALRFAEHRLDLGLRFSYRWRTGERFGFIRTARLENTGATRRTIDLLDGLGNLNPTGVDQTMNQTRGPLADAYKLGECDAETRLGILALNAEIVDRPDPAECLRATVAWQRGLDPSATLLTTDEVDRFGRGEPVEEAPFVRGRKLSYLTVSRVVLGPGEAIEWHVVADVDRGHAESAELRRWLAGVDDEAATRAIEADVAEAASRLRALIGGADGFQASAAGVEPGIDAAHHTANVAYNIMRGGTFVDGRHVDRDDFARFLAERNRPLADGSKTWLDGLDGRMTRDDLVAAAEARGDASLIRLALEYLPVTFSRRHGDPSRPWNRFDIKVRDERGNLRLDYQGNWRDIFQNWEALCMSYPAFTEACIAAFANASTVDGHNPYRITRAGIDWEVTDPDDPWTFIGYWGDHQIVYLLKLLEWHRAVRPEAMASLLRKRAFAYADVPYRIKGYADLLADPRETIVFDEAWNRRARRREAEVGGDGLMRRDEAGEVVHVTLAEKLTLSVLAKLANLVVDGGVWMNTQRPEWNDANNALAGWGLSMVTLNHLRRHLRFLRELFEEMGEGPVEVSGEAARWLERTLGILEAHRGMLEGEATSPTARRALLDDLGRSAAAYRAAVYDGPLGGPVGVEPARLVALCDGALPYLEHSIRASRRADGLYEAYSVMAIDREGGVGIEPLGPMLEGQVAALSGGMLDGEASLRVVEAMYGSPLYRADQDSFMLYPDRAVEPWLERNIVPADAAAAAPLFDAMADAGDARLVVRDVEGRLRFNKRLRNARDVASTLDALEGESAWAEAARRDRAAALEAFERVFNHRAFTGRSGRMFGFEGLGSIYWHMVSKLLLAVGETFRRAIDDGEAEPTLDALAEAYYRVRRGLGFCKSPAVYGAFPTEPYSHSPAFAGAQQPGMTGQVKEEIIARWAELGLRVEAGAIRFEPRLLRRCEFSADPRRFDHVNAAGEPTRLDLPADALAFTFCQTPIIVRLGERPGVRAFAPDGTVFADTGGGAGRGGDGAPSLRLDREAGRSLLDRDGGVERVEVVVRPVDLADVGAD